ncbi:Nup93/Nic96-domain-containing protein [Radiomyces spectabilis]|uniref:Nup93/Nic96-domain-containing protein n=1 Tax=Radiomyces spectabilis TaxID=64574 RepID=UPI00222058A0|nr:Nup93/Nic96-domain-containing protein [Radiomyces spectabilis]KAI8379326.1 Nup93/Nic96-domain-containing protein [Radiomyces spectabilis]
MTVDITFKQLYENSKLLVPSSHSRSFPLLERGLQQIEAEQQALGAKTNHNQELYAQAAYLLEQNGINSQEFSQNLNAISDTAIVCEPVEIIKTTDVEKFLQQVHENNIIDIIESDRQQTNQDFEALVKQCTNRDWKDLEQQLIVKKDEITTPEASRPIPKNDISALSPADRQALQRRVSQYTPVVADLNQARLQGQRFPLVESLQKLTSAETAVSREQDREQDAWQLVAEISKEMDPPSLPQQTGGNSSRQPIDSTSKMQRLLAASKKWLENQCVKHIDQTLVKYAHKAQIGGLSSFTHRLQAYINLMYKYHNNWIDARLEIVNDMPIWLLVYLLLRCGRPKSALKYITETYANFSDCPLLITSLQEYVNSADQCLSKKSRDAVVTQYQQFAYGQNTVDPYKQAVFKIIGRCELNKKNLEVTRTTEDYLWLQLTLIREKNAEEFGYERYQLRDLQALIVENGPQPFEAQNSNPWVYFKVLLCTLQFERAIHYLYSKPTAQVEAVHFAIALVYHGLLNTNADPAPAKDDLFSVKEDGNAQLDFAPLIYQYLSKFDLGNVQATLHYLYLITLCTRHPIDPRDAVTALCHSYIRELSYTSKDFKEILGTTSSSLGRQAGLLDQYKSLIGISSEKELIKRILVPVADRYRQNSRYSEAIYVFELASDYDQVVDILNKQLCDVLEQPQPSQETCDAVIKFSTDTLRHYGEQQHISEVIKESKKRTLRVLAYFVQCRALYHAGQYEQALQLIRQCGVVPLNDDRGQVQQAADQFIMFEEMVAKNIPDVLLMVMDMLYKIWHSYISQAALRPLIVQEISRIEENVRVVLAFVGMIQFKIPADTMVKLNRAEMTMSSDRDRLMLR